MVFPKLGELGDIFKLAKKLQEQVKEIKSELEIARFEKEYGGVRCVVSGDLELKEIHIGSELLKKNAADVEKQVALVVTDVFRDAKQEALSKFKRLAGGLPIPGLF